MRKAFISLVMMASLVVSNMEAQPITAGAHTRVQTVYGPIEGYQDGNIFTFKGIRYAKAERFMPPQKPDTFTELRQCKVWGPQAPQGESLRWNDRNSQTDYGFGNQFVVEPMDEQLVWWSTSGHRASATIRSALFSFGSMAEAIRADQATTCHAMRVGHCRRLATLWW